MLFYRNGNFWRNVFSITSLPLKIPLLLEFCWEIDSKLLSSIEFVTVSKLVKKLYASCCLFLPLKSSVEENFIFFHWKDKWESNLTPCLMKKKILLLAKIIEVTQNPSSVENLSCYLFLSDGSSKIYCKVSVWQMI